MKKVALLTAMALLLSAAPANAAISDITLEKGSLDRVFDATRTLYYVNVDEALTTAPSITATGATLVQPAKDITSANASDRVTVLQDDETGKKYRFVINGNQKYASIDEISIDKSGLIEITYNAPDSDYVNITIFKPKADDPATTDVDESETSYSYKDLANKIYDNERCKSVENEVALIKELEGGADKTYSYQLPDDAPVGMYTVVLGGQNIATANKDQASKYYMDSDSWTETLGDLDKVTDENGLNSFLAANATKLDIDLTEYNSFADKSVFVSYLVGAGITDGDVFAQRLAEATAVSRVNAEDSNVLGTVVNNASTLGVDTKGTYKEINNASFIAGALADGKPYKNADAIRKTFKTAVALQYINEATTDNILKRFTKDEIEDTLISEDLQTSFHALESEVQQSVLRELIDNDYTDVNTLENRLVLLVKAAEENEEEDKKTPSASPNVPSNSYIPGSLESDKKEDGTPETYEPEEEKPASTKVERFTDLTNYGWAREAILLLADRKVLNGKGGTIFSPGDLVTREEFLKMLVVATGLEGEATDTNFTDVPEGAWYESYVKIAIKHGIVKGKSATVFGVGDYITRQEMAVMIYRAADAADITLTDKVNVVYKQDMFTDTATFASYATTAIDTLARAGIISGMGDGSFSPNATATRAQAAQMIYNLVKDV